MGFSWLRLAVFSALEARAYFLLLRLAKRK